MKNKTSALVPYTIQDDTVSVFLQHRTDDAPHNPGKYALFGGGKEGDETPEETLLRETKEELGIIPTNYQLYGDVEGAVSLISLFYMKVSITFPETITILEGQGGFFVSEHDLEGHENIQPNHQIILNTLCEHVRKHQ